MATVTRKEKAMTTTNANSKGIGFLLLAILTNSLQNMAVKWISGNYSVCFVYFSRFQPADR